MLFVFLTPLIIHNLIKKHLIKWVPIVGIFLIGYGLALALRPTVYTRYISKLQANNGKLLAEGQKIFYTDIDFDGNSEEFIYYHLSDNRQPVINEYDNKGDFQNIWYLDGQILNNFEFISGDYNHDSIQEIYVFSVSKDGILLYGLNPEKSNEFIFSKVKILPFKKKNEEDHLVIHPAGLFDLNNDGSDELILSINNRYNDSPRCLVAYNIKDDTVFRSDNFNLQLVGKPVVYDMDKDGYPEIYISTLNSTNYTANTENENAMRSTSIVLDHNLQTLFQPIDYNSRMSVSSIYPLTTDDFTGYFSMSWSLTQNCKGRLRVMDAKGNIVSEKRTNLENFVFDPSRNHWDDIITFNRLGEIKRYDTQLNVVQQLKLNDNIDQIAFIDIDKNNVEECLVVKDNSLIIFDHSFMSPTEVNVPGIGTQKLYFSVKENKTGPNFLSIQNDNYQYLVSYYKNKHYWSRYLFCLFLALFLDSLYFLIHYLVKKHIKKVQKLERESIYLHLDLVKNQLDPHFVFNALNSIAYSVNKDDRQTAYSNLGTFSKFLRETIVSIEEYGRSLEDELNAVKYYLELEKFRFKDRFDYDIILSPEVSTSVKIPKMIIYSYVVGALKKGILTQEKQGHIEIKADLKNNNTLIINVTDNGRYRNLNDENEVSTSTKVMERSIKFFNRSKDHEIKVFYKTKGTIDNPKGSNVEIHIPIGFNFTTV